MKTDQDLRKIKVKQNLILLFLGYIAIAFICIHVGTVFNNYENFNITYLEKLEEDVINSIKADPFFIPEKDDLNFLMYISMLYAAFVMYYLTFNKKYRMGKEHGSARWAEPKEIKRIVDRGGDYNIIFTQTEKMTLNNKKLRKNVNTVVIGSPGTGKSWGHSKPNLLQASCSYVVTDPKGELLEDTGNFFVKKGYKIRVLNLKDMSSSMCYNPFVYIRKGREETDIVKLIDCLITNTNKNVQSTADPFWEKSEVALLQAIFYYIYYEIVEEEHNFNTVMELLRLAEAREEDETFKSDLDIIFEQLEKEKPSHIACKQYKIFKLGAGVVCSKRQLNHVFSHGY